MDELRTGGTILPILRWGKPVLHRPTRPVTAFDDELRDLVRNMFATMYAAEGVGLAATQVGVDLAVFVYDCPDDDQVRHVGVMCNAEVSLPEGKERKLHAADGARSIECVQRREVFDEGCLSLPGAYIELARPDYAIGRGLDQNSESVEVVGTGLLARCLQHETDHLNGIVFGDRLSGRARKMLYALHEDAADLYPEDWPVTPRGDKT